MLWRKAPGFSVLLQLLCLLIGKARVLLEEGLDVGAYLLLFGFRNSEGTDPALDARFRVSPGEVLREPLRRAWWFGENVWLCGFWWCSRQGCLNFPAF